MTNAPFPTWDECLLAVSRSDASPLEQFIHDNEPAGPDESKWRADLAAVLGTILAERDALLAQVRHLPKIVGLSLWTFEMDEEHERVTGLAVSAIMDENKRLLALYPETTPKEEA